VNANVENEIARLDIPPAPRIIGGMRALGRWPDDGPWLQIVRYRAATSQVPWLLHPLLPDHLPHFANRIADSIVSVVGGLI